jgi:hypothetical protein
MISISSVGLVVEKPDTVSFFDAFGSPYFLDSFRIKKSLRWLPTTLPFTSIEVDPRDNNDICMK